MAGTGESIASVDMGATKDGATRTARQPLCIDLDGTLVTTDTLVETFFAALRRDPLVILRVPLWLRRGRAALKRELARHTPIDAATLPYNAALLALLKEEKASGRHIVLVTAADQAIAQSVAQHLGLFDDVIASDGGLNLKGRAKARMLMERYGKRGFAYAGNSSADFAVWDHAETVIVVNAPQSVLREAKRRYSGLTIIARTG